MFTCPHCAAFNAEVFPQIKANFIDTGKVRLVFREVYFNKPSLWAAMIARCAPSDRYFGIADVLFRTQTDWAAQTDPQEMLRQALRHRPPGRADQRRRWTPACRTAPSAEALVADYQKHAEADGIDATPTFFIDGEKVGQHALPGVRGEAERRAGRLSRGLRRVPRPPVLLRVSQ